MRRKKKVVGAQLFCKLRDTSAARVLRCKIVFFFVERSDLGTAPPSALLECFVVAIPIPCIFARKY